MGFKQMRKLKKPRCQRVRGSKATLNSLLIFMDFFSISLQLITGQALHNYMGSLPKSKHVVFLSFPSSYGWCNRFKIWLNYSTCMLHNPDHIFFSLYAYIQIRSKMWRMVHVLISSALLRFWPDLFLYLNSKYIFPRRVWWCWSSSLVSLLMITSISA